MQNKIIQITDLNQQGQGIGRSDGQVVFVEGAVPGDSVRVEITEQHRTYFVAKVTERVIASPDRIEPFCALFDRCGGCALQALDYPAQLLLKRKQVIDLMQRIAHLPDAKKCVKPVLGMDNPFSYRCKIQFPIRGSTQDPQIGFYARRSHDVVDGHACAVGHPAGDLVRQIVRSYIQRFAVEPYQEASHTGILRHLVVRVGYQTGQVMVILVARQNQLPGIDWLAKTLDAELRAQHWQDLPAPSHQLTSLVVNLQTAKTNVILGRESRTLFGQDFIEDRLLGLTFRISPVSFFQVNPPQTEKLYQLAINLAAVLPGEQVLDLYCGTGTIALALAKSAHSRHQTDGQLTTPEPVRVIGVESLAPAIADARINARQNELTGVEFVVAAAENWLPDAVKDGRIRPAAAVIDPPRKGCEPALLQALNAVRLERLVYISCNPATLARDLITLLQAYDVASIQPVDLFPWTDSVENVCLLTRKN